MAEEIGQKTNGQDAEPPLQINLGINEYGRIILQFNRPVPWIGFDATSALEMANGLVHLAVEVIKAPKLQPKSSDATSMQERSEPSAPPSSAPD
jgi:hypothetical protein